MKLAPIAMLAACVLALTACAGSPKPPQPIVLEPVLEAAPRTLTDPCRGPVDLTTGPLTQLQVEQKWIADRSLLIDCKGRHRAVTDFYASRDAALQTKGPHAPTQ